MERPDRQADREDVDLVGRVRQQDRDALAMLYDRYASSVNGIALLVLRDPALAEDCTHDVFLRLWQRPDAYVAARGPFAPWLMRVARNRAIDLHRRRRSQPSPVADDEIARWALDPAPDPADQVITRQVRQQVRAALAELAPEQRRLLELAYFGGMSQSQIAASLQRPLGTVKSQIRTAMRHLADRLGDGAVTPHDEIDHG
jgi:RNA polymerase sigma-70 factor, ECF subfamily